MAAEVGVTRVILIKLSAEAVDLTVGNIGSNDDCRVKLLIEDTTFYYEHTYYIAQRHRDGCGLVGSLKMEWLLTTTSQTKDFKMSLANY